MRYHNAAVHTVNVSSTDSHLPGKDEAKQPDKHHPDTNRGTAGIEISDPAMVAWYWAVLAEDNGISCDEGQEDSILELCHAD